METQLFQEMLSANTPSSAQTPLIRSEKMMRETKPHFNMSKYYAVQIS